MNLVVLMGRITADPELRTTTSGVPVASFTIAVDKYAKPGEEKTANFINIVAWRQTAEFVSKYFSKGSRIIIEGSIQTRKYTDKEGNNRTAFEVVADQVHFGDSKRESTGDVKPFVPHMPEGFEESSNDVLPF